MDRKKVIVEIEDALSGNLVKAGHVYKLSLNGLKDKALIDALALLKEQVPIPVKDVQWHEVTRKRMINGICPTCNSIITHFNGSMFCDKCGQAVRWE